MSETSDQLLHVLDIAVGKLTGAASRWDSADHPLPCQQADHHGHGLATHDDVGRKGFLEQGFLSAEFNR